MPKFSTRSQTNLNTCHPSLVKLFNRVIEVFDCTVIEGARSKEEQNRLFNEQSNKTERFSKLRWPNSKHNITAKRPLSHAVDVAPFPIAWTSSDKIYNEARHDDLELFEFNLSSLCRWYYFAGIVKGIAFELSIPIRWGGDWDSDTDLSDNKFNDLPHFELVLS